MTWSKVLNVWGFIVFFILGDDPFKDQEVVSTVTLNLFEVEILAIDKLLLG